MTQYGLGEVTDAGGPMLKVRVGNHLFSIKRRYVIKETFVGFVLRPDGLGLIPWKMVAALLAFFFAAFVAAYVAAGPLFAIPTLVGCFVLLGIRVIKDWRSTNAKD